MNDKFWTDTASAVRPYSGDPARIIAPAEFQALIGNSKSYAETFSVRASDVDVVVVHKGLIGEISSHFLLAAHAQLKPVFANEVFVVLARSGKALGSDNVHLRAFHEQLARADQANRAAVHPGNLHAGDVKATDSPRHSVYLGSHLALTRLTCGAKMYVDTRDISLAPHLLLDGYWEQWISRAFERVVRPGMTIVDVGANFGYYTLLAGRALAGQGKIYSFEANPAVFSILVKNVSVNGLANITKCVNKAVYSDDGELEFKVFANHLGSSSLFASSRDAEAFYDEVTTLRVPATKLDNALAGERVDVIKLDAEGAEPFIIDGAQRVLAGNPQLKIFMEFAPAITGIDRGEALLRNLQAHGFHIRRITHNGDFQDASIAELSTCPHNDVFLARE